MSDSKQLNHLKPYTISKNSDFILVICEVQNAIVIQHLLSYRIHISLVLDKSTQHS